MYGIAIMLVLLSGLLHAIWNLYTKRSSNKVSFLWLTQLVAVLIFTPLTIIEWDTSRMTGTGALMLLLSMVLHGIYVLLLARTYTVGDFSQVYPIMRGTSPLVVPILGTALLGEHLTALGWFGVVLILFGVGVTSNLRLLMKGSTKAAYKAPLLALAVGLCIASYIIVDKISLDYMPAVMLNQATNIGNALLLGWAAFRSHAVKSELRINWKTILLGGIIAPGGYMLFLYALSLAPVAQLAPMREIGTVFGTLMGIMLLREPQGKRRIGTSILITAGVILLAMNG
ncbi:EamA family transporter [Paenibacillus sp. PR3]|uniref:EamA family transporter n=1 Tax=Paenibacillus terricola TaxID=2763503 RepID=A0ABR8MU19_9BACL|nr:DMT family transporter [Paenibacillus terricola]MBD3919442.1 EamA family transporter [Paenibacillus terricola]